MSRRKATSLHRILIPSSELDKRNHDCLARNETVHPAALAAFLLSETMTQRPVRHPTPHMCARYTLRTPADLLAQRFGLADIPRLVARYNISPTQPVAVIGTKAGGHGRGLALFKWGFVPHCP